MAPDNNDNNQEIKVVIKLYQFGKTVFQRYKMIAAIIGGLIYGIGMGYKVYNNGEKLYQSALQIPALSASHIKDSIAINELQTGRVWTRRRLTKLEQNDSIHFYNENQHGHTN